MEISLETVQQLAPDQASLNAAKKLLKPAKWPVLGQASDINTIWGECQGSGSKPYYTVADISDHTYKCTCPSRKFPCKHVLALMWQFSDADANFASAEPPQWVAEWLGRTRRAPSSTPAQDKPVVAKDIGATQEEPTPAVSAEEMAKKAAVNAKKAAQTKAKTDASISDGLVEFQQWLDDQLVNGISTFIKEINERCRRIASRLVDAKASGFAARVDELPAKIKPLASSEQPYVTYQELGKLAILSEAWFTDCDDVDVRRAIATAENREQVLNNPEALRVKGLWQTVGERVETRKDGLIAHSKWFVNLNKGHQSALLLDFYPASNGRKGMVSSIGSLMEAELVFYPARLPTRALLGNYQLVEQLEPTMDQVDSDYTKTLTLYQTCYPWFERFPVLLGRGRIVKDPQTSYWWQAEDGNTTLALSNEHINPVLLGSDLEHAFFVSDGIKAELMSAKTKRWGTIAC
ncbi:SWIM zinc finger family protein [Motilimonas eburnea]|uniref:SWIM zinc finger family protein n=1 Tax=Motilimonas eburnea TaxID=1737488 RepID=UPI001E3190B8|nr:SWIM zinc finger family protein [Motilimonas eburnea]